MVFFLVVGRGSDGRHGTQAVRGVIRRQLTFLTPQYMWLWSWRVGVCGKVEGRQGGEGVMVSKRQGHFLTTVFLV